MNHDNLRRILEEMFGELAVFIPIGGDDYGPMAWFRASSKVDGHFGATRATQLARFDSFKSVLVYNLTRVETIQNNEPAPKPYPHYDNTRYTYPSTEEALTGLSK